MAVMETTYLHLIPVANMEGMSTAKKGDCSGEEFPPGNDFDALFNTTEVSRGRCRVSRIISEFLGIDFHCIVFYLYIYIALLAVHTNQKRFQCERPRQKRTVGTVLKEQ